MKEKKSKRLGLVIIIILLILSYIGIGVLSFISFNEMKKNEEKRIEIKNLKEKMTKDSRQLETYKCKFNLDNIYGSYYGEKKHPNNNSFTHNVELIIKENNEAILHQSDGATSDYTKGKYSCENNRIIYTPMFFDYENQKNTKTQSKIQYTFIIDKTDKIELNYFFYNKFPVTLKKRDNSTISDN